MDFAHKIREAAAEGAVLLRNIDNTLPLLKTDTVSIFGRCQFDYYRSGTGSGGSVHVPYTTTLTGSLLNLKSLTGCPLLNGELIDIYEKWIKEHPVDDGNGAWAAEPWNQAEMPVGPELAERAASTSNKAVVVIGRTAGEDKDNKVTEGSYLLTQNEKDMLRSVCNAFSHVAVLLNVSNIIDMKFIDDPEYSGHITAVMYVWHGGMEGGNAAAQVICGKVTPSGKLPDTIAYNIQDYPSDKNFGSLTKNYYKEDIYVGYRWFETFAKNRVMFPFGYGLSYTTFSIEVKSAEIKNNTIIVRISVKNTGKKYQGKETVQLYYSAPQGKLGKPARELAAFAKTHTLWPGMSQTLELSFRITDMSSYDDSGTTGYESCYVLEQGEYTVYAGTDVRSAVPVKLGNTGTYVVQKTVCVKQLEQALAPTDAFERVKPGIYKPDGTFSVEKEAVPVSHTDIAERIQERLPEEIPPTGNKNIKFGQVRWGLSKLDDFVAQFSPQELSSIVRGEGMCSRKVTSGTAAAFGGITHQLHNYGIPCGCCSDGPSGIRMDTGEEASLLPIGTLLASTWNTKLVKSLYTYEGHELIENKIDTLLGPGMNIHRHPLNGRNFEYYSEDPLLTGKMGTAVIQGLHKGGSSGTIKHFACNNQEQARHITNSIVSERALREIYLKGFETAVREGPAVSLMTSYNPVNGHYTASNYDLLVTILRREWKYEGLVMTDWWAFMNDCITGGAGTFNNTAAMIRARNDVYMVVDNDGAEHNVYFDNTMASLSSGKLTTAELQQCAKDILRFLLQSPAARHFPHALTPVISYHPSHAEPADNIRICNIDEKMIFTGTEQKINLAVHQSGTYAVCGAYTKVTDKDLSQSVCNIMIDRKPAASFDSRGTQGETAVITAAEVKLEKGYYSISLNHTKPGIDVQYVQFKRTK
ncbi:MAG: glycoside hydrolase family 3 C-terminal domain-containing protein [Treponema sp.]|nr:glycoside hydrolase family 3 C-terminal domain-containing protein [Treponema sp.]